MLRVVGKKIKRGFPILHWLPKYNGDKAISDLVAGITLGLTLIPQSLAYAALAGLSPEYGLYSSLCGGFVYAIFGTIPQLHVAPTSLVGLMVFQYTSSISYGAVPAAILLCFLSGVIELVCGLLHLGFLIEFVSIPVVAGFTSAGAVTIAASQIKNVFGLTYNAETFIDVCINVVQHIQDMNKWDLILSVCCCTVLIGLKYIRVPKSNREKQNDSKTLKTIFWFFSTSRNAIVVIFSAVIAYVLDTYNMNPFSLTTKVQSGLPPVDVPPFYVTNGNDTIYFIDMVKELGTGTIVIPFLVIIANVAIAKAFSNGKALDASQEMLAVGLCNVIGSFFSSIPVNAAFSRAAVNNASGVKTPMSGIYPPIMVILALTFLTSYFSYIPKATLASVIICAVIFMIEVSIIRPMWKINKIDWIPLWGTFISCLVIGIELGILVGILIDIIMLLYHTARPKVLVETISECEVEYLKITPTASVLFPTAEHVRKVVTEANIELGKNCNIIVLDCSRINKADFTSSKCMASLSQDLKRIGKDLVLLSIKPKLAHVLTGAFNGPGILASTDEDLRGILKGSLQLSQSAGASQINDSRSNSINTDLVDNTTTL